MNFRLTAAAYVMAGYRRPVRQPTPTIGMPSKIATQWLRRPGLATSATTIASLDSRPGTMIISRQLFHAERDAGSDLDALTDEDLLALEVDSHLGIGSGHATAMLLHFNFTTSSLPSIPNYSLQFIPFTPTSITKVSSRCAYRGADAREPMNDTPMCGSMCHVLLPASLQHRRHRQTNIECLLSCQQLAVDHRVGRFADLHVVQVDGQLTRGERQ